jgi:hypothetical protein
MPVEPATVWTVDELRDELQRFESELRAAGLADASVRTYVGRSETFVRWLAGDYTPRAPN